MSRRLAAAAGVTAAALLGISGHADQGTLTLTPAQGPVGTTVTIRARGCVLPNDPTLDLAWENSPSDPSATDGSLGSLSVPAEPDGDIEAGFVIPEQAEPLQGQGGGPVRPGRYVLSAKPPTCAATFTVTGIGTPPSPPAPTSTASTDVPVELSEADADDGGLTAGRVAWGAAAVAAAAGLVLGSLRHRTRTHGLE